MREKDVSRLLTDEYAERILVATQITSRSVQEISDKYDIPIAACYRKIHELEEAGFLNVAQIVTTPKGKTMKLYRSLLKSAQLVYQEGIFKVKFEFDVEKEINGKWIELNAPPDSRARACARVSRQADNHWPKRVSCLIIKRDSLNIPRNHRRRRTVRGRYRGGKHQPGK